MSIETATHPSQTTLMQVINRILISGQITRAEQNWFLRATLNDISLSIDELKQIRFVFDRLQMGLLKVVD
ncbi:hypothetical protein IQ268_15045 [Oculatella sp. LEGE 06141]|uniref:hypothetical protein n=1 Tax=Oculatella sp. LEGE 06141 TaxID=1828648 RepID=UPI0018809C33|nr:hypothetical protein [Oculatella sp. LEGE 06141]MBE9179886.1 hypothetical protein [Oculatella sp. LEGE 06141]